MSSSKNVGPEAREAQGSFKMEAANEVGVQPHLERPKNPHFMRFSGLAKNALLLVLNYIKQSILTKNHSKNT